SIRLTADRSAALAALQLFTPNAGRRYAKSRNFDYGPEDRSNVSVLSPYIRHRLLLEEELLRSVLEHHTYSDAQKFVDEVLWRTYFKGWMEHHPDVWGSYRRDLGHAVRALNDDAAACDRYNEAISGRSGIDCFDAWVGELTELGYLHNHARMWFASIWIYTLNLPWQLGADFFLRHLLDGDPASNTLGWRWVCGLHTRGKTYLARVSNIANYTNYRFNPRGQLATSAPPLSEENMIRSTAPRATCVEPEARFGLLMTEEDCSPEQGLLTGAPSAVLGLAASNDRSLLPVSPLAFDFSAAALADGLRRASDYWGVDAEQAPEADWIDYLIDWCKRNELNKLVTAWAPVGPAATRIERVSERLAAEGIGLHRIRRDYDEFAWPHAAKGYFKLKRQAPQLLAQLGVETEFKQTG
ncbi:MAG: FAD-binding domain-containing protein, partial [Pseudomonadota bacterium]